MQDSWIVIYGQLLLVVISIAIVTVLILGAFLRCALRVNKVIDLLEQILKEIRTINIDKWQK